MAKPDDRPPLGEALLAERKRRGLSTREAAAWIAREAGFELAQPVYLRWETGETDPSADAWDALFSFLGLDEASGAVLLIRNRLEREGLDPIKRRRRRPRAG